MLDINRIPETILTDIAKNMDLSLEEAKKEIALMTPEEAFNKWCAWHGLIGWGYKLAHTLDSLRNSLTDEG